MKALSLTQPWASLIAAGHKRYETRSWRTPHRGYIAIHAARAFPAEARRFAQEEQAMGRISGPLPLGAVIAVAWLASVLPTGSCEAGALELRLGDFSAGRFAWGLGAVFTLETPLPVRGRLGLWDWAGVTVQRSFHGSPLLQLADGTRHPLEEVVRA